MIASRFIRPSFEMILPDVAAFALGLATARMLGWNTTDLVWSLWLSSLVLGYLSILSVIGKGFFIGSAVVFSEQFPAQYRAKAILIGSSLALFVMAFFSVHFCGFHAVHAGFLSSFFPPDGVPKQAFGSVSFNPVRLFGNAFEYLMPKYGLFLIPVVVAERRVLFGSLSALMQARRQPASDQYIGQLLSALSASGASAHGLFSRPYLNVVRMHLLIFFFAICHALKIDSFPVFVVVYAVYFFPWSIFGRAADARQGAQSTATN
jgi:hypothetical protein